MLLLGNLAMALILDTAINILGNKDRACQLPLFDYLVERMCALCYGRAWYSKYGGSVTSPITSSMLNIQQVLFGCCKLQPHCNLIID